MQDFNYYHLMSFIYVAKTKNYSSAAKKLKKSRATISEHIESFETEVGKPLFTRDGNKLVLTPAGNDILRHSLLLLKQIMAWEQTVDRVRIGKKKELIRVGYAEIVPNSVIMDTLKGMAEKGERVEFIQVGQNLALDMLEKNQLDLVLVPTVAVDPNSNFDSDKKMIGAMPYRFYAHEAFFSEPVVTTVELTTKTQILPRSYSDKHSDKRLIFTTNNISITDLSVLQQALTEQLGWAFLPMHLDPTSWPHIKEYDTELGREGFVCPINARWRNGEFSSISNALALIENGLKAETSRWLMEGSIS